MLARPRKGFSEIAAIFPSLTATSRMASSSLSGSITRPPRMAEDKYKNDWRIARAEILSKNLDVLSTQGSKTADRRFGVPLSLTRGDMIDAELAVSYALELGKDSPLYMRTILGSTHDKNYN